MDHWKSEWEAEERGLSVNKEKEQPSGSSLKIKEEKEKLGGEGKRHFEGLQAEKMKGGGGGGAKKTGGGKKLLSWADKQHDQGQREEEKKNGRRGRSVQLPKSELFVKKDEKSAGGDKSEKLSTKSGDEDELTKELLSLLAPPPRIHIPESLDPSKVKLF